MSEKKPLPLTPKPVQAKNNSINVLNEKIESQGNLIQRLLAEAEEKDKVLLKMEQRLRRLEGEQMKTESLLVVKDIVANLLGDRISQLEQYTRRYSLIVRGVPYENREKFSSLKETVNKIVENCNSETTVDDIDKFHRNGPREGGNQDIIIRFKSHSAKEAVYKNRKSIQEPARIKIQPSLSSERKKVLNSANDAINFIKKNGGANCPDFALPDVHGNLLVKFSKPTTAGLFLRFDSLQQLLLLIQKHNRGDAESSYEELMRSRELDDGMSLGLFDGQSDLS